MATQYRDIGWMGTPAEVSPIPVDTQRYTQVYQATHENGGRASYMKRSFISFSYGGKYIEDFNLIAYTDGDRMQREAYASFEDLTSTYDVLPGQFYWGTYYHSNSLSITLTTDGIDQRQLDDFKYWFKAGIARELILSEHPNRAIMARIAQPPQLHLLPFETQVAIPFTTDFGEESYTTSTTMYKGEIDLEFVMDEPFWYAKQNILGIQKELQGYFEESWIDANGRTTYVRNNPDALKIIYEDHIPLGSTVNVNVFLGGDMYASVEYRLWSLIVDEIEQEEYDDAIERLNNGMLDAEFGYAYQQEQQRDLDGNTTNVYYKGAMIATVVPNSSGEDEYVGGARISGTTLSGSTVKNGIDMPFGTTSNLYYAGNAPSPVILRFSLTPGFENYYIVSPLSKYVNGDKHYNTITLTATMEHKFSFTLPALWLNYNQVIKIFDTESLVREGNAWSVVRETIRNSIRHPVVRAWANKIIDFYATQGGNGIISTNNVDIETIRTSLKAAMQLLLINTNEVVISPFPAFFTFNGKTGEALGQFTYRDVSALALTQALNTSLIEQIQATASVTDYTTTSEENVGDMVRSKYLILEERNVLDGNYQVQSWNESHPDYAYKIEHDVTRGLNSLHFEFQNLYL